MSWRTAFITFLWAFIVWTAGTFLWTLDWHTLDQESPIPFPTWTDPETGCQYFRRGSALSPRYDPTGTHVLGCKELSP